MTFDLTERSAEGQPVEFLTLSTAGQIFRYTTGNRQETIGVRVFEPLAYERTAPVYSKDSDDGNLEITVPAEIPFVDVYNTPTVQTTTVTIERRHRNDVDQGVQIYWQGVVGSVSRNGFDATILCIPLSALPSQVPRYAYSALCNWFLYQDRCGLARTAFRHAAAVTTVDGVNITIAGIRTAAAAIDAGISGSLTSGELDLYWQGGYIETAAGERRTIYAGNVDANADRVRVLFPFNELNVSDQVQIFAGCIRTRDICNRKFANAANHGGFPDIGGPNIFTTELPAGSAGKTKKRFYGN